MHIAFLTATLAAAGLTAARPAPQLATAASALNQVAGMFGGTATISSPNSTSPNGLGGLTNRDAAAEPSPQGVSGSDALALLTGGLGSATGESSNLGIPKRDAADKRDAAGGLNGVLSLVSATGGSSALPNTSSTTGMLGGLKREAAAKPAAQLSSVLSLLGGGGTSALPNTSSTTGTLPSGLKRDALDAASLAGGELSQGVPASSLENLASSAVTSKRDGQGASDSSANGEDDDAEDITSGLDGLVDADGPPNTSSGQSSALNSRDNNGDADEADGITSELDGLVDADGPPSNSTGQSGSLGSRDTSDDDEGAMADNITSGLDDLVDADGPPPSTSGQASTLESRDSTIASASSLPKTPGLLSVVNVPTNSKRDVVDTSSLTPDIASPSLAPAVGSLENFRRASPLDSTKSLENPNRTAALNNLVAVGLPVKRASDASSDNETDSTAVATASKYAGDLTPAEDSNDSPNNGLLSAASGVGLKRDLDASSDNETDSTAEGTAANYAGDLTPAEDSNDSPNDGLLSAASGVGLKRDSDGSFNKEIDSTAQATAREYADELTSAAAASGVGVKRDTTSSTVGKYAGDLTAVAPDASTADDANDEALATAYGLNGLEERDSTAQAHQFVADLQATQGADDMAQLLSSSGLSDDDTISRLLNSVDLTNYDLASDLLSCLGFTNNQIQKGLGDLELTIYSFVKDLLAALGLDSYDTIGELSEALGLDGFC